MRRFDFTDWAPDQPEFATEAMVSVKNCLPSDPGYLPMPSLEVLEADGVQAANTPTAEYVRGAVGALGADEVPRNFAGDRTTIYMQIPGTPGFTDVSKGADASYTLGDFDSWRFLQFNEWVFGVTKSEPLQGFLIGTDLRFRDITGAPQGEFMAVVGPHLVLGRTTYQGTFDPYSIHWSAASNPSSWPDLTTDPDLSLSLLSGRQSFPGDGGWVQGIVGGTEIGAVFQEKMIWRMDFVGGDIIYDFKKVEPTYGLLIPHLAIPISRNILFLSESGWRAFDYTGSQAVGKERIDRWFFDNLNQEYNHRISWAIDPDDTHVYIAFPSKNSLVGECDLLLIYDWTHDKFTYADEFRLDIVARLRPQVPYLMDGPYFGNLDQYNQSMDASVGRYGSEVIAGFNDQHVAVSFTGAPIAAELETSDFEFAEGRRSLVNGIRPYAAGSSGVQVYLGSRATRGAPVVFPSSPSTPEADGEAKMMIDGRYHRGRFIIPAGGFDDALGFEVRGRPRGRY